MMSFNLDELRTKVANLNAVLQDREGEGGFTYAEAVNGLMDEVYDAWYGPAGKKMKPGVKL